MTKTSTTFSPEQLTLMQRVTAVAGQVAQAVTPDSPALDYLFTMAGQLQLDGLSVMKSDFNKQRNYGALSDWARNNVPALVVDKPTAYYLMVSSQLVVMVFHDEVLVRPHYYITQDFLHASCCQHPALIINFAHDGGLQVGKSFSFVPMREGASFRA